MITKLTKEQEARFPEFIEKWTRIGLSTAQMDRRLVLDAISKIFSSANKPAPGKIIFCHSPLESCLARAVLASVRDSVSASVLDSVSASVLDSVSASVSDSVLDSVLDSVSASVRDSVLDSVRASVSASVSASVLDSVSASVRDSVSASVLDSVRASVSASVRASVSASVLDSVSASVLDSVRASVSASVSAYWWWGFGQFESYWLGFYDFMRDVFSIDTSKLNGNEALCLSAGWTMLFWEFAFVCEKPVAIHRVGGRLHRDGGLAVEYSDGWGVYALNGILMDAEQVLTPSEKISPESVLKETNADRRRELIRKVGVERMLEKLPHKSLDKKHSSQSGYELLSIRLSDDIQDARYLRMLNQSIGVWHLEGVDPSCKTVEEAINWRCPEDMRHLGWTPEVLT